MLNSFKSFSSCAIFCSLRSERMSSNSFLASFIVFAFSVLCKHNSTASSNPR